MEKRRHRKKQTIAELREEIASKQVKLAELERIEREKIGAEMQKWSGRSTWDEIKIWMEAKENEGQKND